MIDYLEKVSLFENLSAPELKKIEQLSVLEIYGKDTVIFREGDPGDRCYVITSGEIRISKFIPNIGEEALAVLKAGDCFGEMALIENYPRSAHAIANSDVALLAVFKADLDGILAADRELACKLLWAFTKMLSRRLRETSEKMAGFLALSGGF